jgi:hypothetical protein
MKEHKRRNRQGPVRHTYKKGSLILRSVRPPRRIGIGTRAEERGERGERKSKLKNHHPVSSIHLKSQIVKKIP